jgi:hypothetical protein
MQATKITALTGLYGTNTLKEVTVGAQKNAQERANKT